MLVKFFATYRQITGCRQCEIPAPDTVLDLMRKLCERWPGFSGLVLDDSGNELGDDVIVMVNGRHIEHLQGALTPLSEEDRVAVTPLVAGG